MSFEEKSITYFDRQGSENTDDVIRVAKERALQLEIKKVVVASGGQTALKVAEAFKDVDAEIICVTSHAGARPTAEEPDKVSMSSKVRDRLESAGVKIFSGSHALSGICRSISRKFGGITPPELIAETLRCFGQGTKVAVEITIMAADAGLIGTDEEVISIGGRIRGADTALVLKPAHMTNFFDLEIREIIAKPREGFGREVWRGYKTQNARPNQNIAHGPIATREES